MYDKCSGKRENLCARGGFTNSLLCMYEDTRSGWDTVPERIVFLVFSGNFR